MQKTSFQLMNEMKISQESIANGIQMLKEGNPTLVKVSHSLYNTAWLLLQVQQGGPKTGIRCH